ncbi:hypothetical protein FJY70_04045 [candidate division WOR-3 bacterium]|nr:hypothetical protein [candidate division WOR-3 bacterium]
MKVSGYWLIEELGRRKYHRYLRDQPEETATEISRMTASRRPLGGTVFRALPETRRRRVLDIRQAGRPRAGGQK